MNRPTRIEDELSAALRPVRAPGGLWEQIDRNLHAAPRTRSRLGWGIAAGMVLVFAASWLALANRAPSVYAAVSEFQRVCGDGARLDLKTSDAAAVLRWASERGVPLSARPAAAGIELAGASGLADRAGIAIAYRSEGARSALLVEPASSKASGKHLERHTVEGLTVFVWRAGAHQSTLITSRRDHAEKACGLCHVETPRSAV